MVKNNLKLGLFVCVVIVASFFLMAQAQAASSDSVAVKVTISPSISVNITEENLSLGSVVAGAIKVSTSAVTVTNNGSGITETYSLSLTNPAGWTASQAATAAETYVLNAAFDADGSAITWSEANHALSTIATPCSVTKFAGDQTGLSVPYNAVRKLWFQFKAPIATSVGTEQNIVINITAQAG